MPRVPCLANRAWIKQHYFLTSYYIDYEGFESDEAVEGSSSDDDDDEDDEDEDVSDDVETAEGATAGEDITSERWPEEKDAMLNEVGGRAGVEEPGVDRLRVVA